MASEYTPGISPGLQFEKDATGSPVADYGNSEQYQIHSPDNPIGITSPVSETPNVELSPPVQEATEKSLRGPPGDDREHKSKLRTQNDPHRALFIRPIRSGWLATTWCFYLGEIRALGLVVCWV